MSRFCLMFNRYSDNSDQTFYCIIYFYSREPSGNLIFFIKIKMIGNVLRMNEMRKTITVLIGFLLNTEISISVQT